MRIPPVVNIVLLVIGATLLYTYIGQLVPQKEVAAPQEIAIAAGTTTEELVAIGKGIVEGKGQCLTCHTGVRAPDLQGVGARAGTRIEGVDALHYIAHSVYFPSEFIVPGFTPGMTPLNKPPMSLTDPEILAVLSYLQSLGGTPTVTLETTKAELGVE